MSNYTKGARGERELLEIFYEEGFVGLRAPSSGSTTERELPDLIVGCNGQAICLEVKRCSGDYFYIDSEEIEDLYTFSDAFGTDAYIAIRFDYQREWRFFKEDMMHKTDGDRYRVKKENIDKGLKLSEII
jgi:Holliday junction resolvase